MAQMVASFKRVNGQGIERRRFIALLGGWGGFIALKVVFQIDILNQDKRVEGV